MLAMVIEVMRTKMVKIFDVTYYFRKLSVIGRLTV
jgi:hypothetical protein